LCGREVDLLFNSTGDSKDVASVFEFQLWSHAAGYHSVDFLPFCMPEARIMFNGRQIILGIPPDCIPGGTLKQKIAAI